MSDNTLEPCPFCGKRQAIHREFGGWVLNTTSHDRKCIMRKLLSFGMAGGLVFDTQTEAIAAWNTRAERTCTMEDTTHPSNDDVWSTAKCSQCGANFTTDFTHLNFCPNCGAKVVDE